ncbi:MAG: hypothetical protein H6745_30975 [Deltaproteobacteria bacterium]|nr:hypothetical protein [Deltaproteobacteria bacterium]
MSSRAPSPEDPPATAAAARALALAAIFVAGLVAGAAIPAALARSRAQATLTITATIVRPPARPPLPLERVVERWRDDRLADTDRAALRALADGVAAALPADAREVAVIPLARAAPPTPDAAPLDPTRTPSWAADEPLTLVLTPL